MAQKRMFDKTITNSDDFIDMPDSAQNLYFHLSMNADDDGFINNWKNIMRMTGHKEDDMKILIAKQYVILFDSGVIVIRHWRINNYLRGDRYVETKHKAEKLQLQVDENLVYQRSTTGIPGGIPSIEKNSIDNNINSPSSAQPSEDDFLHDFEILWSMYPRKEGKADAYRHYKSWRKGKSTPLGKKKLDNEQMEFAIKEYCRALQERGVTEKKFMKMGDTFFNNDILDYLPKEEDIA